MLDRVSFNDSNYCESLERDFERLSNEHMKKLFENDPKRGSRFSINFDNEIFLDFSKNIIDEESFNNLINLAKECKLKESIEEMFNGEKINETEKRAVLHVALRDLSDTPLILDGKDYKEEIFNVLSKMEKFSTVIGNGEWKGYTGKRIKDIVNIGIGGSNLGPKMVCEALKHYRRENINVHFVSNVDGTDLAETLKKLSRETTLFIISSKTFTTQETMTNGFSAREWFLSSGAKKKDLSKHFVAVSTNVEGVKNFGISEENIFEFWDFVGGRYSLWSAIGLSISCYLGFDNFIRVLNGGNRMDKHFRGEDFNKNIPVVLALISFWYNNFFDCETEAVLPYDQYLYYLPSYLQQASMESNGKSVDRDGNIVNYQTAPITWGEVGTDGQHAFYQLIHQGTKLIPTDFLIAANPLNPIGDHHKKLMANFLAQTQALMEGKGEKEVISEMREKGLDNETIDFLLPHKVFVGNKPSNSIIYRELTPELMGMLTAMYEHKIFVQGVLWNLFSFDQWGVELGKQLAKNILPELEENKSVKKFDSSTSSLINIYKKFIEKS
ncbi:MAG: glucose-6-phosphate isomerase [Candidatus Cloacimonadota bacterium]|nr:MAG: glucose-6-phosphate isomerase [Candidatus Cloacimonadota bacterium]PIE79569.1 MAG: glucose-6-phosphate isomerase [Candidatus Delongbacteria bacterium]